MPDRLVVTPGGYRPSSQVHLVEPGHVIDGGAGRLRKLDRAGNVIADHGTLIKRAGTEPLMPANVLRLEEAVARYPDMVLDAPLQARLTGAASGAPGAGLVSSIAPATKSPGLGTGWIVFAAWTVDPGNHVTILKTTWVVPEAPATPEGQLIYLFNGIQNSTAILQPVLQWGDSPAGGGKSWAVASWYVIGQDGPALHSSLVPVNTGDTLVGTMTLLLQSTLGFTYLCQFENIANTALLIQNVGELTQCVETLEAYQINHSTDYPASRKTAMTGIEIKFGTTDATPNWVAVSAVTDTGQFAVVVSDASPGGEIDLHYRSWDTGFSGFAAVQMSGAAFVWACRASDGTVCIHKINPGGAGFTQEFDKVWSSGFTGFAPLADAAGNAFVWAYNQSTGMVCIHEINPAGSGFTQKFLLNVWDKGFTSFAGFSLAGVPFVWAYRSSDGTVCIHKINPGGSGFTQKFDNIWSSGFTGFASVADAAGNAFVWAYNQSTGMVCIHEINPAGSGFTQKFLLNVWDKGFTSFAGFSLAGVPFVWAYRESDGTVCIHKINPGGSGFTQEFDKKWDKGFTSFAAFSVAGTAFVWAYRVSNGTTCIHKINPGGVGFTQTFEF